MRAITVENQNFGAAFDELIECKKAGEFAILEINPFLINTTDDVPDDFMSMKKEDVYHYIIQVASDRELKMKAAKLGIYGNDMQQIREAVTQQVNEKEHNSKKM